MGANMELGEKVVILYDGGQGTITHLAQALVSTSPSLQRVVSSFPWKDSSGRGESLSEIVHFKDDSGVTQVSFIVLYQEVPASACGRVVHELFDYVLSNGPIQSHGFSLIVPAISRMPGSTLNVDTTSKDVNIYTAFVNGTSESTGALGQLPKLPSTFAVKDGLLAYIFHYAHATGLPTLVLVSPSTESVAAQNKGSNEVLYTLADVVGRQVGLSCSKEKLNTVANSKSLVDSVEADWRRLYI
ncbi:hypothetical protein M758_7G156900 [Ceratodon purpureus]|uniref:DUF7894 domain-containing protein n=1 Tax=Ceratodon purpureus TaxID=3225 RepID=A0A8T0H974_CERPU|nr:hypothetical protein KC19_7G121400 [Ceratodon purpureus]KAG0611668.1 hypothetical protein M758_7G156900 [Ceratodon purpureus]